MKRIIKNTHSVTAKLDTLLANLRSGKGSAGKFLTDDSLYIHLDETSKSLDSLAKDIKKNPEKYLEIKVF